MSACSCNYRECEGRLVRFGAVADINTAAWKARCGFAVVDGHAGKWTRPSQPFRSTFGFYAALPPMTLFYHPWKLALTMMRLLQNSY